MLKKFNFTYAALGYALLVRISLYLTDRALWLDEILLARNIQARSFADLFHPLSDSQMAPFGFLVVQKTFMLLFGQSEYIFRLAPFLASIAAVILFYVVAKKITSGIGVSLSVLLFALSPALIRYSAEGKQYIFDVLITLTGIYLASKALKSKWHYKYIFLFGLFGGIAIWISHPSVFVIGAIGFVAGLYLFQHKRFFELGLLLVIILIQASLFYASLLPTMNAAYGSSGMSSFFDGLFPPFPVSSVADIKWYLDEPLQFFSNPLGLMFPGLAIVFCGYGVQRLWTTDKHQTVLLLAPLFLTIIAAYMQRYPIHDRLALFLTPIFYLLIAHGLAGIKNRLDKSYAFWLLFGLFIFHPLIYSVNPIISPSFYPETRETLAYLHEHIEPQDAVYVYYKGEPSFNYYGSESVKHHDITIGKSSRQNWWRYLADIDRVTNRKRVWFYFAHVARWNGVNEKQLFLNYLNSIGQQKEFVANDGASLYLYEFPQNNETSKK